MRRSIIILFWILILSNPLFSAVGDWTTYTNMNYSKQVLLRNGYLWVATTGGLVKFDLSDETYRKITTVEGLGGNYLYSLAVDTSGTFWFGAKNGTLTKYNPQGNSYRVYDLLDRNGSRLRIKYIVPDDDKLWVGLNKGVSLFQIYKNDGEIKETYRHFGNLDQEIEVNSAALTPTQIWVGTVKGVAFAPKDDPNLLDYSHWYSFVSGQKGLSNDTVNTVLSVDEEIYIGTNNGVFEFNSMDSSWSLSGLNNLIVHDLKYSSGKIYAGTNSGVYVYESDSWSQVSISGLANWNLNSVSIETSGNIWAGTEGSGISAYANSYWTNFQIDGPPGNIFNKIAIEDGGKIWCSNWSGIGSSFDGINWYEIQDTLHTLFGIFPWMASVFLDSEGNVWYGSWGGGLFKLDLQGNWTHYDSTNSSLRPIQSDRSYTVVSDVVQDDAGTIWAANFQGYDALGDRCLAALQGNQWMSYLKTDGIKSNWINSLYAEGGHLWICSRDAGLGFLDYMGTPGNKTDDSIHYYDQDKGNLSGSDVKTARYDLKGKLWVGTNAGLDLWDPEISFTPYFRGVQLPDPLGPQVNWIAVDEMNNKWIGTINGVGVLNDQDSFIYVFTTTSSKLVDDQVWFISVDNTRGKAWIGTENGLSSFQYKVPAENLCQVHPYPNPVVLSNGDEKVTFDVPLETKVRIYTVAGDWVAEAKSGGTGKVWDLRNRSGNMVASGIYLFLLFDNQRGTCAGKIVVIRE
jgi:ligand-binding sensor domain-containing protein